MGKSGVPVGAVGYENTPSTADMGASVPPKELYRSSGKLPQKLDNGVKSAFRSAISQKT